MPDSNNNIDYKEELFQKMRPLSPYTQRDLSECNDTFDDKVIDLIQIVPIPLDSLYGRFSHVLHNLSNNVFCLYLSVC